MWLLHYLGIRHWSSHARIGKLGVIDPRLTASTTCWPRMMPSMPREHVLGLDALDVLQARRTYPLGVNRRRGSSLGPLVGYTPMLALTPACDLGHLTLVRRPYLGWWDMCRVSRKMVSVSG